MDCITVTFWYSSERSEIAEKLVKETTIVKLASSNESESTEGKTKTTINGNEISWVHINNLRPGVLFSSAEKKAKEVLY